MKACSIESGGQELIEILNDLLEKALSADGKEPSIGSEKLLHLRYAQEGTMLDGGGCAVV